jgi:hypothetical protein
MTESEYATALSLIQQFESRGIVLDVQSDRLVAYPARRLKPRDREVVRRYWRELFTLIRSWRS